MLTTAKTLKNCAIQARDGSIGKLKDFLVEDIHWAVRYLVVDVGSWLHGREVLISPSALVGLNPGSAAIAVDLTKDQVRDSPPIETDKPVSRQHEADLHGYYGWAPYWAPYSSIGLGTILPLPEMSPLAPTGSPSSEPGLAPSALENEAGGDPHLRSVNELRGYAIEAQDGDVGHLEDLVINDTTWSIPYALIDTKNWWPGGSVVVPSAQVNGVSWSDRKIFVSLTREAIKASPSYGDSSPVDEEYTNRLAEYYVRRREEQRLGK